MIDIKSEVENEINALFDELVPPMGKADTVAGEIIRATCRIVYRWYNDGDCIDLSYGKEVLNAPARYLCAVCNVDIDYYIRRVLWGKDYGEEELVELQRLVLAHIKKHPELMTTENKLDMYNDFRCTSDTWYSEDDYDGDDWNEDEDDDYEWSDPFAYNSDEDDE